MIFIHAVTGCDMTSRIFGVGKKTAFQKLIIGDPVLQYCANAFTDPNQTTEVIDDLGCQLMAIFFGGKCTDSLTTMQYKTFSKKVVAASSTVMPERLLSTESLAKFHCRRAWSGWEHKMLWMPWTELGMATDNRFVPLMSTMSITLYNCLWTMSTSGCDNPHNTFLPWGGWWLAEP